MSYFNIVAETNENTVVTQYEPVKKHSDVYQSEAELEAEFIRMLTEQGYEYINAHSEDDMIANLRKKLEELNDYVFSDSEWERFFKECIANKNDRPEDKTRKIQEDSVQVLKRDDNMTKNITLIDRKNIHNNRLQIINQYVVTTDQGARHDNRYDVTVLVNGFPMVHIELKRRGVAIREAFNQITRYERDSFSAGYGLFTEYHNWDVPYRYMVKGNLNHLVHEFYYVDDGDEARHSHNEYEGCILIFEDEKEHQRFKIYVRKNWDRKDEFVNDIWIPHMEQLPGYNMDAFREEYLNVQILRRMLQEFRNNGNTKN